MCVSIKANSYLSTITLFDFSATLADSSSDLLINGSTKTSKSIIIIALAYVCTV